MKTKVYFGKGGVKEYLLSIMRHYGDTVMLAYGGGSIKKNGIYDQVMDILKEIGKKTVEFSGIMPNPTYAKVQEGAIVTASGTGAEMNPGAVITNEEKKIKGALFGAQADFVFLDPEYTMSVPMKQVISGAFDTLSHAMETYFGKPDNNNLSDDINEAVMKSIIQNIRCLLTDNKNYDARSELMWASSMAKNGILKIGKITDFQAHQIEHQLGAYTDCNHGQGLAVIHPVLYRHIYQDGAKRFARFAVNVWGIEEKGTVEETALAGVESLAAFIKEIGLPTSFTQMGISSDIDFRAIADSTNITAGCCKKLTHDEIYEILKECI